MAKLKLTTEAIELVSKLDEEELCQLNDLVVERIKLLRAKRESEELNRFRIGDMVRFESEEGETVEGIIIKVNRRTVGILAEDRKRWKVPPSFLTNITYKKPAED